MHTDTGTDVHTNRHTPVVQPRSGLVGPGAWQLPGGHRWSRQPALSSVPCPPPPPLTLAHLRSVGNSAVCPHSLHLTGADQGLGEISQGTWMGKSFQPAPRCPGSCPRLDPDSTPLQPPPHPLAALLSGRSCPSNVGTAELRGLLEAGRGGSRTQKRKLAEPRPCGRLEIEIRFTGV